MLVVKNDQMGSCERVRVSIEEMEEVDKFNNLRVMVSTDGGMVEEVAHIVLENDGKVVVERERNIQRSKTGIILKI